MNVKSLLLLLTEEIKELELDMHYCRNDISINALQSAIDIRKKAMLKLLEKHC